MGRGLHPRLWTLSWCLSTEITLIQNQAQFTGWILSQSPDQFLSSGSVSECGPGLFGWNCSSLGACKGLWWWGPLPPSGHRPLLPQEPGSSAAKFEFCSSSSSAFPGSGIGSSGDRSRPGDAQLSPGQLPAGPAPGPQRGPSPLAPLHHLPSWSSPTPNYKGGSTKTGDITSSSCTPPQRYHLLTSTNMEELLEKHGGLKLFYNSDFWKKSLTLSVVPGPLRPSVLSENEF